MRAAITATRKTFHVRTLSASPAPARKREEQTELAARAASISNKRAPAEKRAPLAAGLKRSMEQSYPALFAAGVLMLLVRRPLAEPLAANRAGVP